MLIIILPGGVSHALAGCCIAAIIIPVTPTTPLKVKKPPLIILFIVVSSYKNIMVPNVISTQGASSPFHNSIGTGSSSRMVGIFFFELLQSFKRFCADCVFNATGFLFCGFRVNTGLHQHRREELVLFQCDFWRQNGSLRSRSGNDVRPFAEILSHAERQPRGIHLASIPPDAVLHPQTVPPPFSSEGVGSLPDNLPLTHALPIPSLLVHPATAMVLSQVQTFFSWEGYCLNSIKQKNSVSKKYFRPAVRILKLSKSFKILLIERAVGFLPPAHTPPAALSRTSSARFFDSLKNPSG